MNPLRTGTAFMRSRVCGYCGADADDPVVPAELPRGLLERGDGSPPAVVCDACTRKHDHSVWADLLADRAQFWQDAPLEDRKRFAAERLREGSSRDVAFLLAVRQDELVELLRS
jgi:hypothetical protein